MSENTKNSPARTVPTKEDTSRSLPVAASREREQAGTSLESEREQAGILRPTDTPPYFTGPAGRFTLYQGNCLELMPLMPAGSFDLIFADPPYFLSNGGITCQAGKMVSVNKGKWDRSMGFAGNYAFTTEWISRCQRLLKPNGTMFVSGTSHIIHIVGAVMDELGLKILNDITWVKPNPPPNLSCRYFTHAAETILWAGRDKKCRHKFNYPLMKRVNGGKQMKSVWTDIETPRRDEKVFGKHPTQKPLALLERIIAAASDEGDLVLDPFSGSATTGIAAARMNRQSIGLEMETEFLELSKKRFKHEFLDAGYSPRLDYERKANADTAKQKNSSKRSSKRLFAS